jgi:1-pyrroline-5-carboxylate dehydrogenase
MFLRNIRKFNNIRNYTNQPITHKYVDKIPKSVKEEMNLIINSIKPIPLVIGGKKIYKNKKEQTCPYDYFKVIAEYSYADKSDIKLAIDSTKKGKEMWNKIDDREKINIFKTAANLVTTKYRDKLLASTMLGQGKNIYQAEIDTIGELADFLNFNVKYYNDIHSDKLINTEGIKNSYKWRSLDGFVASITPFNFTAIGGNLATTPLLMGNTVIWKPSEYSILSNYIFYELMIEAGMPSEVLQFIPSDPNVFMDEITKSEDLGGIAFTGSSQVFDNILKKVYSNVDNYKSYPRIIGETGGNNYHFVMPCIADKLDWVVESTINGAFEYSGQKCSATSRLYLPENLYDDFVKILKRKMKINRIANVDEDYIFSSAVIHEDSFRKCFQFITKNSKNIVHGGNSDSRRGYFINPTVIKIDDLNDDELKEEIFGPILMLHTYKEENLEKTMKSCVNITKYNLTGSVFYQDKNYQDLIDKYLINSVGNFYINDKSTGSIVGQQPFGGFGKSGTNDKAGSKYFLTRFGNQVVTKEKTDLFSYKK